MLSKGKCRLNKNFLVVKSIVSQEGTLLGIFKTGVACAQENYSFLRLAD